MGQGLSLNDRVRGLFSVHCPLTNLSLLREERMRIDQAGILLGWGVN